MGLLMAELLSGWQRPDGTRIAAIRIALEPGWKTYWRTPGEAGIPPRLDFTGSANVSDLSVRWPAPEVFDSGGLRTVGYHDGVVLPLVIRPVAPAAPVDLRVRADIGICGRVCVPVALEFNARLQGPGRHDPVIETALAAQPRPADVPRDCTMTPMHDATRVTAKINLPISIGSPVVLFELKSRPVWVSDAQTQWKGDQLIAWADFVIPDASPFAVNPADVRITLLSDRGALEIDGCDG